MNADLIPIWKKAPFLRIIIPFIAGLMVASQWNVPVVASGGILLLSLSAALMYNLLSSKKKFLFRTLQGASINIIWFAFGMLTLFYQDPRNDNQWIGNQEKDFTVFRIRLREPLAERNATFKSTGEFISAAYFNEPNSGRHNQINTAPDKEINSGRGNEINTSGDKTINSKTSIKFNKAALVQPITGKVLLYFRKNPKTEFLQNGSVIFIKKLPDVVPNSANPGGYDYKAYLELKGIYHQFFLAPGEYIIDTSASIPTATRILEALKIKILGILDTYIPGQQESGLAKALLVGYKEDLESGFLDIYSKTGVIHVIAISGLHLAVIYLILSRALDFAFGGRKKISVIPVILGLWIFTLLAGAGPSVSRSALMFTIIAIGESGKRKSNIINSLSASAFLLLLYDPFWLWDLGFQLSYSAVLSLILTQKGVYNILYISNRLLDELWKITSVTLSAQILTLPVLLYNFHQFPVYFLFTNLVSVPLSSLALILELVLCAIFFIEPLALFTGKLISFLLALMTDAVIYFYKMPFSGFGPIQISWIQVILLYLLIISFYHGLKSRQTSGFILGGITIVLFSVFRTVSFSTHTNQLLLIIYHIPGGRAIGIIDGRASILIADSALLGNRKKMEQYINPSFIKFRINQYYKASIGPGNYSIRYKNIDITSMVELNHLNRNSKNPAAVRKHNSKTPEGRKIKTSTFNKQTTIILAGGNRQFSAGNLLNDPKSGLLVTDGIASRKLITDLRQQGLVAVKDSLIYEWKASAGITSVNRNPAWHHTGEKGAFVMKLN